MRFKVVGDFIDGRDRKGVEQVSVLKFEKKTMTFGGDEPIVSVCRGHVDLQEFGKAQEAEGWDFEWDCEHELVHEWWILGPTHWGKCQENHPNAKPVTALYW